MNLTWHIVKKDLRRLRWLLVGWGALMLVRIGLGLRLKYGDAPDPVLVERLQNFNNLFLAFQLVVAYVLVSVLIHEEPLLGANAFWRVRPISGGRLLRAKLLGLAVLGLVPEVVSLPWWLSNGFGLRDIAWASLETVGLHAAVIMGALLVAALTDGLPRFLAWTLVLITATGTFVTVTLATTMPSKVKLPLGVIETRFAVGLVAAVLGIAAVVVLQFLTRRPARSVVLAVVTAGLVFVVSTRWPWDWSMAWSRAAEPPSAPKELANAVTITLEQARLSLSNTGGPNRQVDLTFSVRGLAGDFCLSCGEVRCTWRWTDGTRVQASGTHYDLWAPQTLDRVLGLPAPKPDPETQEWYEARRQARRPMVQQHELQGFWISCSVPAEAVTRMRSDPPVCTIELPVYLLRMVTDETSLRPGAGRRTCAEWRLERVEPGEEKRARQEGMRHLLFATIVESRPALTSEVCRILHQRPTESRSDWAYFLVNPLQGNRVGESRAGTGGAALIDGVAIGWRESRFALPMVIRQGEWQEEFSPDWFDHATLARVEMREVGWFKREIKVDRFELKDPPAPPEFEP